MSRAHSNGSTESEPQSKSGQVIAVFGTKGGVGKTLIAANLAVALRRQSGKRVALFDADFYFGDVGVHPNLPASRGMLDLIEHIDELKPELAEHFLVLHDSGVRVLLSPFQPEDAELITAEHVHKTLEFLAQTYDYTIVDCHSSYDDCMLMVLEHADEIMLIVTPEIGSLKNTVLFLELISKMGLATTSVRIILNRAKSVEGIATKEVENMLRRPVAFHIASGGRSVVSSVNRGTPLTLKQADHPFAHQIRRMSQCLIAS